MSGFRLLFNLALVVAVFGVFAGAPRADEAHRSAHGLANYRQVSPAGSTGPRIDTGGQPESDADFQTLANRGVRVIVSVDGARPDVIAAQRHGIRTIHLPVGYDGIDAAAGAAIYRLVHETDEPIYIHCHHGRHRGPAAAAIAAIAAGQFDQDAGLECLHKAGTDPKYTGLWRDVRSYRPPSPSDSLPQLVAAAEVEPIVTVMLQLETALSQFEDANDSAARLEQAIVIEESYRESARLLPDASDGLRQQLRQAESTANVLVEAIRSGAMTGHDRWSKRLSQSCVDCHNEHRR